VIQHNKIGIKVLLGIWLDGRPGYEGKNAEQVATGIRLANQYKKIVLAVSVGNEILVSLVRPPTDGGESDRVRSAGEEGSEMPGHGG